MSERTLILVKPDGVNRGFIGNIISRIENKGFLIEKMKMMMATDDKLRLHYKDKINKSYFPQMVSYMKEGPIIAIVVNGTDVIKTIRTMTGATMPNEASPGTIRGDLGRIWEDGITRNVIHSSDSHESAEREISIWF
ncbi:nucleoside-diphosphate kinase [Companilactobacillus sp. DQM5]|uniref:nucleoside-diphosphate kinase n=1 Tax=Companilactobacillus sp. DQM5 TaxID=3463359 RepID=UPI004059BF86